MLTCHKIHSAPYDVFRLRTGFFAKAFFAKALNLLGVFVLSAFTLYTSHVYSSTDASTILLKGESPIELQEHLLGTAPPEAIFNQSTDNKGNSTDIWYKLVLRRSEFSTSPWLIIFRQVPFRQLDVFTPRDDGFQLNKLGMDNRISHSKPFSLNLDLNTGETKTYYLRYQPVSPNQLAPELWPLDIYNQYQNNQNTVVTSLLVLLIAVLLFTFILNYRKQTPASYLMLGHTLAASILLVFWQGDIFRTLPWLGDPGHWVALLTILVMIAGIASYRQLTAMATHAPVMDKLILGSCTLSLAMTLYFLSDTSALPPVILETAIQTLFASFLLVILGSIRCLYNGNQTARPPLIAACLTLLPLILSWGTESWPRSLPSYLEVVVLSLHAATLPIILWFQEHQAFSHSIAINVVNSTDKKRRIYESALRMHLQNPETSLDEEDIPNRVLSTIEEVLPAIPAVMLIYQTDDWHLMGEPSKVANQLRGQLPLIGQDLIQIINSNKDTRINFKDRLGQFYWIFPLSQETDKVILLAMAPSRSQRNASSWQTACDISNHAHTLLQASRQSLFWQQQASLDSLTGLLNRRALCQEAEQVVTKSQLSEDLSSCCALFIDIDLFKNINDRYGHARGDFLLKQTAKVCRQVLRHQDLLGRYGGEEFVAILPNTEPWQALHAAERIRKKIVETQELQESAPLTLSIGLSALSHEINTLDQLIAEADSAMYLAKQQGRNRTCISPHLKDARLPS